jgi:choline dehydrogenase-like flavoprotein
MTIPEEVDIIICGGGSSGCVPAGRLANLDHNLSVLLIEAGEDNLNNQWFVYHKSSSYVCSVTNTDLIMCTGCIGLVYTPET